MRYYSSTFHIECSDANLLQAARELLADALGEGGYEAFEDTPDGMIIRGGKPLHGASVRTFGDHRLALSFAAAALAADGETTLDDETCVAVSYPGFFDALKSLSV